MQDCLMRPAHHPVSTPPSHHGERRCARCGVVGCVVPSCIRHHFEPRHRDITWRELAAGEGSGSFWRCTACRSVRTVLT